MACGSYMEVIEIERRYKPQDFPNLPSPRIKNSSFHPEGEHMEYPSRLLQYDKSQRSEK